jgi:hypothetical protein
MHSSKTAYAGRLDEVMSGYKPVSTRLTITALQSLSKAQKYSYTSASALFSRRLL